MSVQKRQIILNASTVKISGGLIVAQSYVEGLCSDSRNEVVLICPKIPEFQRYDELTTKSLYVPDFMLKWIFRWVLDLIWLPWQIRSSKSSLLITLNNIPAKTRMHQVFMHDNPYLTHGFRNKVNLSFKRHLIHLLRVKLTLKRLRYVDEVWVQSSLEQKLFRQISGFKRKVQVLPPMIPAYLIKKARKRMMLPPVSEDTIRLICLSNYFEHKNIERLFELIQLSISTGIKLQLIFTLSPNEGVYCGEQISRIKNFPQSHAMNIGHIDSRQVSHVIDQCDGVILPSLMETFGLNCLDAWLNKKPYFISDLPYARKICGDSAIFFNPDSAREILHTIQYAFTNSEEITRVVETGARKIKKWPGRELLLSKVDKALGS